MRQGTIFQNNGLGRITNNEKIVLKILLQNSRTSDTVIADKLRISSQAVSKIKRKLKSKGIISEYTANLDYCKLGINTFAFVMFDLPLSEGDNFFHDSEVIQNSLGIYRVLKNDVSHIGLFAFTNLQELDKYFDLLHSKYADSLAVKHIYTFPTRSFLKHSMSNLFSLAIKDFGKEKYSLPSSIDHYIKEEDDTQNEKLSKNEKEVLKFLIQNGKINCNKIASEIKNSNITVGGVNKIKKRLEDRGIIRNYSIKMSYEKLGINVLAFLFVNKKKECWEFKDGLYKWAYESPNVIGSYKLNQDSLNVLFCGFRNFGELERYCKDIEKQNKDLLAVQKVFIVSPNGIIGDSPFNLVSSLL